MDDFSHLKVLLETPALTYQGKRGREGAVCPGEGEDAAEMRGCDGSGSTYKDRSEPQAPMATGDPVQRCTMAHLSC